MSITKLPHELVLVIGSYLPTNDLCSLCLSHSSLTAPASTLLRSRAAAHQVSKDGDEALTLWLAINGGDVSIISALLAGSVGRTCTVTNFSNKPLHMNVHMFMASGGPRKDPGEAAKRIFAQFPDIIVRGSVSLGSNTPLHDAARSGNLNMVVKMLNRGHPLHVMNRVQQDVFQAAILGGHADVAAYLRVRGIRPQKPKVNRSPLSNIYR